MRTKGKDQNNEKEKKEKERGNLYDKIFKENMDIVLLSMVEEHLNFKIVQIEILEAKLQSTIEREVVTKTIK